MLLTLAIRTLEVMFVVGVVGSSIVVLLTAIEDFRMLFVREKKTTPAGAD